MVKLLSMFSIFVWIKNERKEWHFLTVKEFKVLSLGARRLFILETCLVVGRARVYEVCVIGGPDCDETFFMLLKVL